MLGTVCRGTGYHPTAGIPSGVGGFLGSRRCSWAGAQWDAGTGLQQPRSRMAAARPEPKQFLYQKSGIEFRHGAKLTLARTPTDPRALSPAVPIAHTGSRGTKTHFGSKATAVPTSARPGQCVRPPRRARFGEDGPSPLQHKRPSETPRGTLV